MSTAGTAQPEQQAPETFPVLVDLARQRAHATDLREQLDWTRAKLMQAEQALKHVENERDEWKAKFLTLERQVLK